MKTPSYVNESNLGRLLRIAIGITLILLSFYNIIGKWGYVVGVILLISGLTGFCPLYKLLGINMKAKSEVEAKKLEKDLT